MWSLQERSQSIEAQLAETTSQLHELRLRQRQLEARNSLLEKVAVLNKQQSGDYLRSPSGEQVAVRDFGVMQIALIYITQAYKTWHSLTQGLQDVFDQHASCC